VEGQDDACHLLSVFSIFLGRKNVLFNEVMKTRTFVQHHFGTILWIGKGLVH
jgi:hypothetical protein